jgi:hypothetical protein
VVDALQRDLQAAQYAARRAQKQFDAADLAVQEQLDQHIKREEQVAAPSREDLLDLAIRLEQLWPEVDPSLRKRIVRALIHEVIVDVDEVAAEVVLLIHWKGGVHSELRFPRRRHGQTKARAPPQIIDAVRALANSCTDDLTASALNRGGLLTGRGNRWSRERVTSLRTHHKIACFDKERCAAEG